MRNRLAELNEKLIDYYGIIGFILLWQAAPALRWVNPQFIPPPSTIIAYAWKIILSGDLFIHAATSVQRILFGLIAAIVTAVPLGVILAGWFPRFTKFVNPLLHLLGHVNAFTLFPIFILFFGIGELAKFTIIYWSSIWPIFFTTIAGVENIEPNLVKAAKSMGANRFEIFYKVILPGAAPSIFTGLKMGATTAFLMLIAAEMLGSSAGLGWLVHNSAANNIIPRLFVAAITIALLGSAINYLIQWSESQVLQYKEEVKVD